jgi:hypothetical protein
VCRVEYLEVNLELENLGHALSKKAILLICAHGDARPFVRGVYLHVLMGVGLEVAMVEDVRGSQGGEEGIEVGGRGRSIGSC